MINNFEIKHFMTANPITIGLRETIANTQDLMNQRGFRHLPIVDKDKVVGVVSDRDVKMASSMFGSEARSMPIKEICVMSPYTVSMDTSLHEVAQVMGANRIGCAIVVDGEGNLAGIFTTVDACKILALLAEKAEKSGESLNPGDNPSH